MVEPKRNYQQIHFKYNTTNTFFYSLWRARAAQWRHQMKATSTFFLFFILFSCEVTLTNPPFFFSLWRARRSMTSPNEGDDNYFSLFYSLLSRGDVDKPSFFLLSLSLSGNDADDAGLVNRLPFRQFGLDFETVFRSLFLLLFCISAILWPLALNRLFDPINPKLKVYWAAVPPIRPWPWNGFQVLVPPAPLYLRYFMIGFEILNISCSIFGWCGKKWKFCFINFEGQ